MNVRRRSLSLLSATIAVAGLVGAMAVANPQVLSDKSRDADQTKEKQQTDEEIKIGEKAPNWTLTSIDGKEYSLEDFRGKTLVIEWTNPDCPYIQGVYQHRIVRNTIDEMEKLGENYAYVAINSTAVGKTRDQLIKENGDFVKQHKIEVPVLIDFDQKAAKAYNAKRTPEMYVIDPEGILRYHGAYTDDNRFNKGLRANNYVLNALKMMAEGETVSPDTTRAWGCTVKYADGDSPRRRR